MGRKNRRKKIAAILRKARERRKCEALTLADPQTVTGQSLCTVEDFEQREKDLTVARRMKEEEVVVPSDNEEAETSTSWLGSLFSYFW
jgi:hypothetical protein